MNLDLRGKKALVCGSTQGIGKAAALELALLGATVTLLARNESDLKKSRSELSSVFHQKHDYLVADFSRPDELRASLERYMRQAGTVHILVNNTGGPPGGAITEAKTEEFTQAFSNHLVCNHILSQAVLPGMKDAGYGRIINVISTSVKQPLKGLGVSNTVRAAVANWSKTLAGEVAKYGITVNNVLPGATNTQRLRSLIEAKAQKTHQRPDDIKAEMIHEVPMARFAEAAEIANAIAFLASPAAAYITGINVPVDGGRTSCL
ncbi:MAG TPA: SDR family oxidoreductase [Bacteroidia bacterium]|nr:SDR family oxidoreductase [Bacteroidia bacterium]